VEATAPIIVERAVYWGGMREGHDSFGILSPAYDWYLAEGDTTGTFETFVLVQNPNPASATVTVTYQLEDGTNTVRTHTALANSRYTIAAHAPDQVGQGQRFAAKLQADQSVIVERAVYWNGFTGGHGSVGIKAPALEWGLAEGYTGSDFETFLLIQNPNDAVANVTVTYQLDDGTNLQRLHSIGAQRRYTIRCRDAGEAGADAAFSTKMECDVPIVVERSMYWGGYAGGHCSAGRPVP
jgi:hypothetical protein